MKDVSRFLSVERIEQIWITTNNGITCPGRADHDEFPQQHVHAFLKSHRISMRKGPMAEISRIVQVDLHCMSTDPAAKRS